MAVAFSLTYLLVLLQLVSCSHFRGGIVQWRPLNNNPMSFNGQVEVTFRIAWRRTSGGNYCDQSIISSRRLLGYGALTCRSGCSGNIGSLQYYCTDYSATENWSAGTRTYTYNAGSRTNIEASYASCCWIGLNRGGGSWEIRVKMNLSPRSDNGLINSSPISNMPPIVRVQRSCNGRISVPVSDADGDDVRCRWASSSRGECAGVCQTFPATLSGCALIITANSLSNGWYGVALQIEDFASATSTTPLSSIPLQFLVNVFDSSASCASRPELVGVTPPDASCYPVASGSTWRARIVAQSGSSSVSITDIVTASPAGLTKSSLRSGPGTNQWYIDVTWSPSASQTGPNIFCYYAQDSIGLSSTQSCITLLGRVTAPRPLSMSPTTEIISSTREWTIVFDQPFRRPTTSKYIRIYEGNTLRQSVDVTSTSLATYPSSNQGRSLIFRTSYNFVIGRSYNIRLDEGVAVDNTYCGLNSTAITSSSFWSVTVVVCFSGMVRLVSSGSYDFEGRVEVCVNGGWGTVCDDGWSTTDARVLCRQLNFTTSGIVAFSSAQYGQGSGPILIDDIACTGTETSLQSCTYDSNTGDCSHAEDAGVRCHSLPTVLSFGGIGNGLPGRGEYVYFWLPSWTSSGVTISITLSSGYLICYASDRYQTPSNLPGYADWVVTINSEYTETFIDPSSLSRPRGSFLSFAFLGQQSLNNFTIQIDSGRVLTTTLAISNLLSRSLGSGSRVYYNLRYPSNGLTLTLTVTSGRIICYASVSVRNPSESDYDWKVDTTGREEAYLDPAILTQVGRPRVFITLVGMNSNNYFTLNSTIGGSSAVELTIGSLVTTTIGQNRFVYYFIPFSSSGVTIRIDALVGGIRCYASDTDRRPSSRSYVWTLVITDYDDSFLDPSTLGRTPGSSVYIALQGINAVNTFTMNTTIGDTSIEDVNIGSGLTVSIGAGVIRYYAIPFTTGGITLRLDVSVGYITCYASDTFRNPGPGNYVWLINTRGYADGFIDPASQFGRMGTRYIYVALVGVDVLNTFELNSAIGNFSSQEISIGGPVSDSIGSGRFRFYIFPFLSGGVTIRVEVFRGGVWCYGSDTNRNPSSRDYIWRLFISGYNDSYIDPRSLSRDAGPYLFIAIEGINPANDFSLNSTSGDTSIADVNIGNGVTVSIGAGVTKYYSVPFTPGGITLRLGVSVGYITCYASDTFRNPGPGNYVWLINTRGYADGFIDPASQFGRTGTRFIYVALVGVDVTNTYLFNSTTGNFSSQEISIGGPVSDSIGSGRFRFYIFPFLSGGVTIRVEVFRGGVWCYGSDTNRNPSSRDYIWRLFISGYNDSYIDPRSLSRDAGPYLFIAIEGINPANDFSLNSTSGDTSIADFGIGAVIGDTISNGVIKFYSLPFPANGITLSLTVTSGYVNCYASDRYRNPNEYEYDWFVAIRDYWEVFLDPNAISRPLGSFLYVSFQGINTSNVYLVNSSSGDYLTIEPRPPTDLQASNILPTTATITWQTPPPNRMTPWGIVINYEIILTEYAFGLANFVANTTAQSYTLTSLEEFNNYTVVVAAENTVGRGGYSVRFNFSTPQAAPTAPPRNPTASRVDATPTLVTLSWQPPVAIHINGIINHYVVRVREVYTGRVFILRAEEATIQVGPLHPFYIYECQVAAFTVAQGPFGLPFIAQAGETEPTAAPQNISFASRNASSITLSWNPPPFEHQNGLIRSYSIIVTHINSGFQQQITTNSGATNYTVGGLQPFMNYTFSLAAETVGLGPYSLTVTIGTVEGVPTISPANLAVSVVSATALYLSWSSVFTPVGDVRDYTVRLLELDTGLVIDFRSTNTFITVPVHPAYSYNCSVAAVTVGRGPFSAVVSVSTPEDAPSGYPQNLSAVPTSSSSVYLTWQPPLTTERNGEIVLYTINVTVMESSEEFQLTSLVENFTLSSLRPYYTYSFAIAASTVIGEGPFSLVFTIRMPEDVPSAPVSVQVGRISGQPNQLSIVWQPPTTPNGMVISYTAYCFESSEDEVYGSGYLGEANRMPSSLMYPLENITSNVTVLGSESSAVVSGLDPYKRYACFVTASTSVGKGEPSYAASAVTDESTPSSPPINLVADVIGSRFVILSWLPPAVPNGVITSYTVSYNLTGVSTSVVVQTGEQFTIPGLDPYSYYQFTVFASTAIGDGPPTLPIILRTAVANPGSAPQNFTAVASGRTSAWFSWDPPSVDDHNGVISYYLLRLIDTSFNLTDITINTTNRSYSIDTLEEYVRYSCLVAAGTVAGVGPYSSPVLITTHQDVPTAAPESLTGLVESSTLILVSWDPPPPYDRNGEIVYYLIHMRELDTGRFWTLPVFNNKTSAYIGSLQPYYRYECRVAARTIALGPYSESVILQTFEDAPSSSPMAILPQLVTETSFTLTWQPPSFEGSNGVIRQYIIQVLEVDTGITFMEISNLTELTLEGLHPFYSYSCRIAAETIGIGPFSNPVTVQLNEDVPTAAPSVTLYSAVDSTSLFISWLAPPRDQQNGMIRRYDITLTELETGTVFSYSTSHTNFTASLLHPNYQYQVEISAVTIGSGPSSASLIVMTPEDAPSAPPDTVYITEIYSDSIGLSWSTLPPEHHNGEIIGYNISLTATYSGERFTVFSVTNSTIISSLVPFTSYSYSVAAVTVAGVGPYSSVSTVLTGEAAPIGSPEQLNVTEITSSSVFLTWQPPPLLLRNGVIREYKINLTEVDTGRILVFYSSTTSITITALHPFYTYFCRVGAFTVEYGPYTESFRFVTLEDAPSGFPRSVSVSGITSQSVEVSWSPPPPEERNGVITGYMATLVSRDTGSQYQLISTTTSITFTTLTPFTSYTVTIAASTAIGLGPQSTQLNFMTDEDVPVGAPLNPTGVAINSRTLSFTWDAPPEEDRNGIIREYRVNITELETRREFQMVSSTTSILVSSLHPYYTYQWAVTAFTVGEGPFSAVQSIITPQDVPSGAPQSFTAVSTEVTTISLAWQLPLPEDRNGIIIGYTVSLSSVSSSETRRLTTTDTNLTVTSLTPYTTYECIVAAFTSIGEGPPSSIILVQTEETTPIGIPSNTSGIALNSTHIYIDWDPPPVDQHLGELREYRITVNELETLTSFQLSSAPAVTEATIGPLHPYYTYTCTILAVTIGEGPPSTVITVRTAEDVPSGSPTNFTASSVSSTAVQLFWSPPLPQETNGIIRQYMITVEPLGGEPSSFITTATSSYTVSALRPFTSYLFSVAAVTIGPGPPTEQIQVETFIDAPGGPPESVVAQPLDSTSLVISWEPPQLELRNGIIQQYTIRITEVETGTVNTLYTEATTVNVSSLHPYYTYSCIIAAETIALGPFSYPVQTQLPESAPSSPPINIEVTDEELTSTSFVLYWSAPPPEDHNGLIRHYVIRCTELETGVMFQWLTVNATERRVDSLHPFYSYTCVIAAVTVAEGPYSSSVTVATEQDAPSLAPIGLSVTSQTSNSLTLAWMAPPPERQNGLITGYSINVTNTDTGASVFLSSTGNSITIGQLSPYTSYLCSVAAQTIVGQGPYTSPITVTTGEDAPIGSPVSLEVVSTSSSSVTLSWSPPPDVQLNGVLRHYILIVQELDSGRNVTLTSTDSLIVLSDLHPYYSYAFAVCPVTIDTGPCANFEPVQLPQDAPSGAPENIVAMSLTSTSVQLSWNPPPADQQNGIITDYYLNMTEVETRVTVQLMVTGATSLLVDTLHPYYMYNFFISAATIVGQGPYSTLFSIRTQEDAPSSSPLSSAGEVLGPTAISISWQPPAPEGQNGIITSYTVLITEVLTNTTTTHQRDGSRTEIVITGLHPYYDYSCAVAAQTSVGLGPFGAPFTVTTHQDAPSSPPQNIEGSVSSSTSIQLTWQPPAPSNQNGIILHYVISVTEEETMRQFQLMSTSTTVVATALHPYYTYSFTVSAVTVGEGPYSQPLSIQTLEDAPSGPPQSFRVVAISSTSIRLTWSAPLAEEQNGVITSYRITVTEVESGERVLEMTAAASDTLLIVDSLNPHSAYRCSIAALTIATGPETSVQVTTLQEAPSGSPRNTSVSAIDSSRVVFEWVAPSAEDSNGIVIGYTVRVTGQDSNELIELQTNMTSIQVDNLHPFYSYVFTVAARTEAGVGPFSPVIHLQMPSAAPTGIVSNVTVQIDSPTSVRISWLPINLSGWNGILTSYIVQYERQGPAGSLNTPVESYVTYTASIPSLPQHPLANSPDPRLAILPLTLESLLLEGLEENYVYEFTVYCVNSAGSSEMSNPVAITMPSSAPSGAPLNVTVKAQSSSSILITWQPPEALKQNGIISSYDVEINSTLMSRKYRFLANTTNVTVTGLEKFTDFQVFVAASTSLGNGPFSKSAVVKTLEDVPGEPRNLDVTEVGSTSVRVSWSPPLSANGIILEYQVNYVGYEKVEEKEQKTPYMSSAGSLQQIVVANLTGGFTYEFKVRARTSIGYGNFSAPEIIKLDAPTDLSVSDSGGGGGGGGGGVAVAVVFAILGWIIFIATIVAAISALLWYKRRRQTKKLGLHDTTEGLEFKNEVFLRSFDTKEEDIEGDVISNPTAGEDDPQTKVDQSKDIEEKEVS